MLEKIKIYFFKPIEIKTVEFELRIIFNQHFPTFSNWLLDDALSSIAYDSEIIIQEIRNEKRTPHEVALTIVNNMTATMLASGKYHVFFGVLDRDKGEGLYAVFDRSLSLLSKHNYLSQQEVDDTQKNINQLIATIG